MSAGRVVQLGPRAAALRAHDPDYEEARRVYNALHDRHPALIVRAGGVDDVRATLAARATAVSCSTSAAFAASRRRRAAAGRARTERRRRSDGERSRQAILDAAARFATVEGLEGLTIGRLADSIGMSKSGLYAHFGSEEELQLATIDNASAIFEREVTGPAFEAPEGAARIVALCDGFLSYVERKVFPGGCFFASAVSEFDARSGPVRERLADIYREWIGLFEQLVAEAQAQGDLDRGEEPAQLAFELDALLLGANDAFLLLGDARVLDRARTAIRRRLT